MHRVQRALDAIPNDDAPYDTWLILGMALHSTGESWARDLWDGWSRQSGKFDERKQDKSWGSFTSDGHVTIGSLFHLATQHGYVPPPQATLHVSARNGHGMLAAGAAQQHGHVGMGQTVHAQTTQPALDATEAAREAAAALLQTLPTLAEEAREDAVLDALAALVPLDTISWTRLKR
jgi:Primase C terminal 2 (PriCT-2)